MSLQKIIYIYVISKLSTPTLWFEAKLTWDFIALTGNNLENTWNFRSPERWEPCKCSTTDLHLTSSLILLIPIINGMACKHMSLAHFVPGLCLIQHIMLRTLMSYFFSPSASAALTICTTSSGLISPFDVNSGLSKVLARRWGQYRTSE